MLGKSAKPIPVMMFPCLPGAGEVCQAYPCHDPRGTSGAQTLPSSQVCLCHVDRHRRGSLYVQGQEECHDGH